MGCGSSTSGTNPVGKPGKADVSSINTFDIEFNLDNVELLYDYQHGQYLYPTEGNWDYDYLNSSSGFSYMDPKPDKKSKTRIKKIDDVITMRNLNLEQRKEMEDTSLWDDGEKTSGAKILPLRVLPLYKPGDTICGHLVLQVSKPVDAKQVKLLCTGVTYFYIGAEEFKIDHIQEETQLWRKTEGTGKTSNVESDNEKCNSEKTNATNNENKENEEQREKETTQPNDKHEDDQNNDTEEKLVIGEDKVASSEYIPVGRHRFPFSFQLPETCPASVPNIASGSFTYICINYRLKALIERRTLFGLGNVVQYRGLWVHKEVDISKVYSQHMQPSTVEEEFESAFTSGKINVKVTTQRRAFTKKEAVHLEIEIDNEKGDATIEAIEGRLLFEGKLYSLSYMEEEIQLKGKKERISVVIPEGKKEKCNLKVPFSFNDSDADNNLMPSAPGAIAENEYVVNPPTYNVKLKFVRKGLQNENFEMKIPINIGTIDSGKQINNNEEDLPTLHENILYE